jgi:hypothetical protein
MMVQMVVLGGHPASAAEDFSVLHQHRACTQGRIARCLRMFVPADCRKWQLGPSRACFFSAFSSLF